MQLPRHRWFPYKEGFSPSFVKSYLSDADIGKQGFIFDPFSGSGTTPIVAGELGVRAAGFDVSPLSDFVARTKSITMNRPEIDELISTLAEFKLSTLADAVTAPENQTIQRYFEPNVLLAILRVKAFIKELNTPTGRFKENVIFYPQ